MADAAFSLLHDAWLPVRREHGVAGLIRPAEITASLDDDPVVALDWPRPDLRVACLEFLIGLLATACPPESTDDDWRPLWERPPSPERLDEAFAPLAHAFVLDGDGPRFLQDIETLAGEAVPVERLLIDTPGENAVKRNSDLLVKRGRVQALGRPAAAMALYALQAFAPAGGAGHRTSLRGGGPLTTLAVPGRREAGRPVPLWHLLWANVPLGESPAPDDLPTVFPWLAPTRRSDAGGGGTALDTERAHRLQAFWGMPRRIRLDFRPAAPGETCGLTGREDAVMADGFRTRPGGVQYLNAASWHPLTPTYTAKPGDPPLAVHPQPDGIGYRHWAGLVAEDGARSRPAAAVADFAGDRNPRTADPAWHEARLLAAGYDMDNMKARAFVEAEMPLFALNDPAARAALFAHARRLARGATEAGRLLRGCVLAALAERGDTGASPFAGVRERFFEVTDPPFWEALRRAREAFEAAPENDLEAERRGWLALLRACALALFDEAAPLDPLSPEAAGRLRGGKWVPPAVVEARRTLGVGLAGHGPAGKALFEALVLPPPERGKGTEGKGKGRKAKR